MSHTPGPWNYDDPDGKVRSDEGNIASVWNWCIPGQEGIRDANARLIAAAPELLEALIDAQECVRKMLNGDKNPPELDPRGWAAAIAKATGGAQ